MTESTDLQELIDAIEEEYRRYMFAGEVRSGLRVHTDALTGCKYLSSSKGHITPRYGTECFPND